MRTTGRMITVAEPAWGAMPSRTADRAAGNVTTVPIGSLLPLLETSSRRRTLVRHGPHYVRGLVNGPLTEGYAGTRPTKVSPVWLFGRSGELTVRHCRADAGRRDPRSRRST